MGLAPDLKELESLMTDEEAAEILKVLIRLTPTQRGDGKSQTRMNIMLALHKAVKALESRN